MLPTTHQPFKTAGSRTGLFWKSVDGWTQRRPYNLMLPLDYRISNYQLSKGSFTFYNPGQMTDWLSSVRGAEPSTDNTCYSKFIGKLRAQNADLGVTLGEYQSAQKMITSRCKGLWQLADALLHRDFKRAGKVSGLIGKKSGTNSPRRNYPNEIAGLWLEWSWGWAPMISDIGNALETLVDPVVPIYARASHTKTDRWRAYYSTVGSDLNTDIKTEEWWDYTYRVSTGGAISVDNPNVALANRLGVLNIPGIIWAVQPFSFIVDKYVNIGQMIGSLSDTFGFTLTNTWTAKKISVLSSGYYRRNKRIPPNGSGVWIQDEYYTANGQSSVKLRSGGLLGPTLALRTPSIGSFGEAASYFALMLQIITGRK